MRPRVQYWPTVAQDSPMGTMFSVFTTQKLSVKKRISHHYYCFVFIFMWESVLVSNCSILRLTVHSRIGVAYKYGIAA